MRAALPLLSLVLAVPLAAQIAIPRGIRDHTLCCGTKPSGLDGSSLPADHWAAWLLPGAAALETPAVPASPTAVSPTAGSGADSPPAAAAAIPAPPPLPAPAWDKPLKTVSGYTQVGFDWLAGFALPSPATPVAQGAPPPDVLAQVPAPIKRLDGKKVLVTGFMLPVKIEKGFATEFLLLSSPLLCCYGVTPAVNQWILVKMRQEGLPPVQDVPMPVAGRLRLRAQWESGLLTGIYELEGEGLLKPAK